MADSATQESRCHPRKLFVGGLPHQVGARQLREHFGQYGAVTDAVVLRWPDGRSRGFGYVTFVELVAAGKALGETHSIDGLEVDVKRAVPGTNKIFVGGLPQNASASELRAYFETFGVVSDAVVMIDPATRRSRGFGFVCFLPGQEGVVAVASALEQYQSHRLRGKWVEVKSAAPSRNFVGVAAATSKEDTPEVAEDQAPACQIAAPPGLPTPPPAASPSQQALPAEPQPGWQPSWPVPRAGVEPDGWHHSGDALLSTPPGFSTCSSWANSSLWASATALPRHVAAAHSGAAAKASGAGAAEPSGNGEDALPSLLAAGRRGGVQTGSAGRKPAKQQAKKGLSLVAGAAAGLPQEAAGLLSTDPVSCTQQEVAAAGAFDAASAELQRSLEQLLRLHAEQQSASMQAVSVQSS